ncbi:unnamed protein product [Rodentolepis nana]|uniref:Protein unc-13 homolog A n=1 Tax=Rodentolepis nana TaxID=102285 RepID=A0A0R3TS25_RODNA|nr:unnamed protein product [Rodentolepis nana]
MSNHNSTTQEEEDILKLLRPSRSQSIEATNKERDYGASLREYSKFSVSVSQLFDSTSLNNIVEAVEREPPISQEEQLRRLRIRAGLIGSNLPDYYTQSYQHQQNKANQNHISFTGSMPALNIQSLPKPGNMFGSFISKAQNAASGLMKQVNVVAEAAKQVVSDAQAMIVVEEKPQQSQLQRQFSTKEHSSQGGLYHPESNLPELTPPAPDEVKGNSEHFSEFVDEDESRAKRRAWGQLSSTEENQNYDQEGSFEDEEEEDDDDDRDRWIKPQSHQGRGRNDRMTEAEINDEEAWLRSSNRDERAAIRARDGMLMAAVTGIHDPMVNGQSYYEDEEDYSDQYKDDLPHQNEERNGEFTLDEEEEDEIMAHVRRRHQKLQDLSEGEDDFQSGYSDEEVGDEEVEEGDDDNDAYSHHLNQHRRSRHNRSFVANEDEEDQCEWDEDPIGSNEETSSCEYYNNKQNHKKSRNRGKQDSSISNEAMRMVPPPEDEPGEKRGDPVNEEVEQKRKKRDGDTNHRSSLLQTRLESLKPTPGIAIDAKHPLARKRWFDAFDHVCRQLTKK